MGEPASHQNGDMKKCPKCAERVLIDAKFCKHCQSEIPEDFSYNAVHLLLNDVKGKNPPGYLSSFIGAWFFAVILCLLAFSWPKITGTICFIFCLSGIAHILKKGIEKKERFQYAMLVSSFTIALLVALGSGSSREKSTSQVVSSKGMESVKPDERNSEVTSKAASQEQGSKIELTAGAYREFEEMFTILKKTEEELRSTYLRHLEHAAVNGRQISQENSQRWGIFSGNWNRNLNANKEMDVARGTYGREGLFDCPRGANIQRAVDKIKCGLDSYRVQLFLLWSQMNQQLSGRLPAAQDEVQHVEDRIISARQDITAGLAKLGRKNKK